MLLRLNANTSIEDLREHPPEILDKLRQALAAGAVAREDPHRESFYEVQSDGQVFYICVSPISGTVLLLGTWPRDQAQVAAASEKAAAD